MANLIALSASLEYQDVTGVYDVLQVVDGLATSAGRKYIKANQTIGITEEAIILGEVTAPGWAFFLNRDLTNFIDLRVATAGAKFARLFPGGFALLMLGSGAQVPFAIADTTPCVLEYLIVAG